MTVAARCQPTGPRRPPPDSSLARSSPVTPPDEDVPLGSNPISADGRWVFGQDSAGTYWYVRRIATLILVEGLR